MHKYGKTGNKSLKVTQTVLNAFKARKWRLASSSLDVSAILHFYSDLAFINIVCLVGSQMFSKVVQGTEQFSNVFRLMFWFSCILWCETKWVKLYIVDIQKYHLQKQSGLLSRDVWTDWHLHLLFSVYLFHTFTCLLNKSKHVRW